jgi:hypothetical protein
MFRVDTGKKQHILALYSDLRLLLSRNPGAAMLITFNLRKLDRRANVFSDGRKSLLNDPRGWLEDVCGTLDILNRSDVRLGMDLHEDDVRVINGIRRGEEMHPLLIRPILYKEQLSGFELCPPDRLDLKHALTPKQVGYWDKLPAEFRFEDAADKLVPRSTLKRILDRGKSLGVVVPCNGGWKKVGSS